MLLALLAACTPTESNITQLYPSLVVSPGEVNFGEVVVDYQASAVVEIINGGRVELVLKEITFNNDFNGAYTLMALEELAEQDTGTQASEIPLDLPITLDGDERLQLSVSFLPGTYQDYDTALSFVHNDPDQADFELSVTGTGSDGPTPDIELDTQTLDFDVVTPGQPVIQWITINNIGDGPLTILDSTQTGSGAFTFAQKPNDNTVISAGGSTTAIVSYLPESTDGDNGSWTLRSDDPDEPELTVQLLGNGGGDYQYPVALIDCPSDIAPPETRTLDGSASYEPNGLEIVEYIWSLGRVPSGASAEMTDTVGDSAQVYFDIAGSYEVTLQVVNELGVKSAPAECDIDAIPEDAIHVELLWNTSSADMDLHMLRDEETELFDSPDDACFCNRSPNWGALTSSDDDPRLDIDDRGGFGPENINVLAPADGRYPVVVHYFDANGDGESTATLRYYINGVLELEQSQVLSNNQEWTAGIVSWPEGLVAEQSDAPRTRDTKDPRSCF